MPKTESNELTKEEPMPAPRVEKKEEAKPSLEGLVKMKRADRVIHAHPSTIHDHKRNGWKEV